MFSGVVKIADIDDYITPSQNCIKPISDLSNNNVKENQKNNLKGKKGKLIIGTSENIEDDFMMEPDLIKLKNPDTKSAKITLNDCLACSGCVTTAETLLIQAQSVDEFLKNSILENKISICCISPQSILSIAYYFKMNEYDTFDKICSILQNIGIKFVLNFNTIIKYCLEKAYEEFCEKILILDEKKAKQNFLITSECPGWICYAEKKIGDWIIPYLSNIKSPQQVMGNFLKNAFSKIFPEKEIYISCIMPCFDKKLEATRENHRDNNKNLEIDTVISTIEILDLLSKLNIDLPNYMPKEKQTVFYTFSGLVKIIYEIPENSTFKFNANDKGGDGYYNEIFKKQFSSFSEDNFYSFFYTDENFSSNGYTEFILSKIIKNELDKNEKIKHEILRKNLKNSDFKEIELKIFNNENIEKVYNFAIVYGFRNIQNLIRNKNKIKYHYIEVMACPGGCLNGGVYL